MFFNKKKPDQNQEPSDEIHKQLDKKLNLPWNKKRQQKVIQAWQESIIKQEQKLIEKADKTRDNCIKAILMFNHIYVLEDEEGTEYTPEYLNQLTHKELKDILYFFIQELKKDLSQQ